MSIGTVLSLATDLDITVERPPVVIGWSVVTSCLQLRPQSIPAECIFPTKALEGLSGSLERVSFHLEPI